MRGFQGFKLCIGTEVNWFGVELDPGAEFRPGFLLQVISEPGRSLQIKNCIFNETTTIGLRFRREKRMTLPRKTGTVKTTWGPVLVKRVETHAGRALYPEYEDCRRVALENNVPLKDVYAAVNRCTPEDFISEE